MPKSNRERQQQLDLLKDRLEISPDNYNHDRVLLAILDEAKGDVLDYCRRTCLVGNMPKLVRQLAVIKWNRRGAEGESSRSEGGISQQFDDEMKKMERQLNRYRLGKMRRLR